MNEEDPDDDASSHLDKGDSKHSPLEHNTGIMKHSKISVGTNTPQSTNALPSDDDMGTSEVAASNNSPLEHDNIEMKPSIHVRKSKGDNKKGKPDKEKSKPEFNVDQHIKKAKK